MRLCIGTGRSGLKRSNNANNKIKVFTDKASSGWEYEGDGQEAIDFFMQNSNFEELISQMDEDERKAFQLWAAGNFMSGQQYWGWDAMYNDDKAITQIMDKYLDQATLKQGVEVTRLSTAELILGAGRETATLEELQAMEGSIITSQGSLSTAAAAEGLAVGDRGKSVEYKITIPPGSKGAGMWIGDGRVNYLEADQREFMMNRDCAYKVGKTVYNKKRKKYIVNIEWAGLMEHDYGTSGKLFDEAVKNAFGGPMFF